MKRILVIDDDEICRRTVSSVLQQSGYAVEEANNGLDGLESVWRKVPDLVVCDVVMPRLDGLSVFDNLRSNSKTESIPFIFMTGMVEKGTAKRGPKLGANEILMKPFALSELLAKVRECMVLPANPGRTKS